MSIIPIQSESHWHEIRRKHVGGSEIAALFDESPYLTRFELWHYKKGGLTDIMADNERTFWGKILEAGIAEGLAKQEGWEIDSPKGYYVHASIKGMGCTPDFFIKSGVKGFKGDGVLQIKNVSFLEYRDNWIDGEPPLSYLLQLQEEIACTGCLWGAIGALIGGNEGAVFPYPRHENAIKRIEQAIIEFWETVERDEEPRAVADDYQTLRRMFKATGGCIDLTHDNELPELCANAIAARMKRLKIEREEEAAKAEILRKIRGATLANCNGYIIEYPEFKKNMAAQAAHVQTYRQLNIKEQ